MCHAAARTPILNLLFTLLLIHAEISALYDEASELAPHADKPTPPLAGEQSGFPYVVLGDDAAVSG